MIELHPRLATDTGALGETELCWLRWMRDARFPWLIVVPKRDGLREWHHLPEPDQQRLLATVNHLAGELERVTGADKINLGALGNLVPQLHVHIIARFRDDPCWPGPVWGQGQPVPVDGTPDWLARIALPEEKQGMELIAVDVQCPHCWEHFEALVDPSQGDQQYVEDCHICCRPLVLTVDLTDPEAPSVSVTPEND